MAGTRIGPIPYSNAGAIAGSQIRQRGAESLAQSVGDAGRMLGGAVAGIGDRRRAKEARADQETLARDRMAQDQKQFQARMDRERDVYAIRSLREELAQVQTDREALSGLLRSGQVTPELEEIAGEIGQRESTLTGLLDGRMAQFLGGSSATQAPT